MSTAAQGPRANARIRVLTLNIAHGRKNGFNQALQRRDKIRSNLQDIAGMLQRLAPDIVALQEADGPSLWSGRFDHVAFLAEQACFPHFFHGNHVNMLRLRYGTAVMSAHPVIASRSIRFQPSPPLPPKGFVISTVETQQERLLDIVSVHLDFARRTIRERQCEEMVEALLSRDNPLVIMGDFNCEYSTREQTLRRLASRLKLHAYDPDNVRLITFPTTNRRIDWILCSRTMRFVHYEVVPQQLSDHRAVIADLEFVEV